MTGTVNSMNGLHAFFKKLNFSGELIIPVITVRQDKRGRAYGFCTQQDLDSREGCCWQCVDQHVLLVAESFL